MKIFVLFILNCFCLFFSVEDSDLSHILILLSGKKIESRTCLLVNGGGKGLILIKNKKEGERLLFVTF